MKKFLKPNWWYIIPVLIAVLSVTVVGNKMASSSTYQGVVEILEKQERDVMTLSATAAGASAAITLIPGDAGTPIAEQLADLSTDFVYLLAVIVLEKYIMNIAGFISFKLLIPLVCLLVLIIHFVIKDESMKKKIRIMSAKIAAFAVCLVLVVPVSAYCTEFINSTYEGSMNQMIEDAKNSTDTVKNSAESADGSENVLKEMLQKAGIGISSTLEQFKQSLTNISRIFAYMLVSSCLIPVCVLFFFLWIIRLLFGLNIPIDQRFKGSDILRNINSKKEGKNNFEN